MASSEKELIPLNDLPPKHESIPEKPSTAGTTDLVPSKFPSRPRRKVVVVVTVIAVVVLVIIAASLIGKYIPEYLRDAENKSRKDTTDKGAEEPKGPISSKNQVSPTATSETKSLPQTTSSVIQHTPISPIPEFTTFAAVTLSSRSDISASSASSRVADLSVIANLLPNTESKWSRWSPWSDCTKTCGTGTRYRNRACVAINDRAVFAPISCAGKSDQIKLCAEWKCPDCSRNCTIGTLNAACDACTCIHHELSGRVLTEDDIPLSDANISLAETPYNIIAQTNISGYFATLGVCAIQQELLITKAGFVPVKLMANVTTPTTVNITAKMEIAVAPFVTVHPESKMRMPGQSVTFCCEGEGNPPPEIEWFKENNVIDKSLYNYNNTLEINDVQGLNGTFRCRAINQFGSEFSSVAELIVLENSEDSCPLMPSLNDLTLPPGCLVNGTNSTIVNVGECDPIACVKRGVNFSSSCSDPPFCCGPLLFGSVSIKCAAMSFDLSVVKRCGCGKCIEKKQTIISGIAVGQNGNPAILVDLFFRGKSVGNTNAEGKFSFPVPETTKRAIVTFKDQKRKKFVEEDKIFSVEKGQTAIYTVKLREKLAPVTFNASEPLDVALGSDSSDSFADLELPENALLTEDGSVFSGIAKATVSVTDPRNQSDIESAPGDFSSMNEDGEEELLQTFGMIRLHLEDDSGKPLTMSKPMKVYLDSDKLNSSVSDGNVSTKLYWLDKKTGRWREAGEFMLEDGKNRRRKRSDVKRTFLAVTVTPSLAKRDLNFDTPRERVAVRVTIAKNSKNSGASERVLVRVICPHPNGYFMEKDTKRRLACIVILRNADCFVQALKGNYFYEPATSPDDTKRIFTNVNGGIVSSEGTGTTIKSFRFESKLEKNDHDGPTYSVESAGKEKCKASLNSLEAPNKTRAQFEFKSPEYTKNAYEQLLMKDPSLWSSTDRCFIRVVYKGKEAIFMAVSYWQENFDEDTAYGYHLKKTENSLSSGSTQVVCLQFPCPVRQEKDRDPVFLLVTPVSSTDNAVINFNKSHHLIEAAQSPEMKQYKNPLEKRFLINYLLIGLITFENPKKCLKSSEDHLEFT